MNEKIYDAIIIGGGGAGLRSAMQIAQTGARVAVVSKVFPTRSHTVSAQGGINAALGNTDEDNWHWHMFDTVKGSDYLGDQDSIEYMCHEAPDAIYELEHMGMPFSRNEAGDIYQRRFGGQSKNFGQEQAARTCAVADRTGHALLHTLFQQNIKHKTEFYNEWFALDLVKSKSGDIAGALVLDIATGEVLLLRAGAVVLATGGAGKIFQSTTNAYINTGDGLGMALRAGYAMQDMEMWQFHPTGIAGAGVLVTEGCRGEGGYLVNKDGERFMERYAPNVKDLASRDVVSRAMTIEIREGRGCGPDGNYVYLKLEHLGEDVISKRLPGIRELAKTFAHADPVSKPIPVVPTCHYMMGGIPTNVHGQVLDLAKPEGSQIVSGLYAVGECACVSVHGANRLGGNSLLDLVVFGRACGLHLAERHSTQKLAPEPVCSDSLASVQARLTHLNTATKGESSVALRHELETIMQSDFGVFRTANVMADGIKKLQALKQRSQNILLSDKSQVFNTARIEALELSNLVDVALATALSANARTESRGAHSRQDFPERDDKNWLKHTVYHPTQEISYRNVSLTPKGVDSFPPKERVY